MFAEGRGFDFTKRIVRPDGEIRRLCDVLFSYFFFGSFAIFDISPYATPLCYVSSFIFDRSEADKKTAKLPVMSQ